MRNVKVRQIPLKIYLSCALFLFVVFSHLILPLQAISFYNFIWLVPMCFWYMLIFLKHPSFFSNISTEGKIMAIFSLYTIIVPFFFNNETISNRFISLSQIPFVYFVYTFNKVNGYNYINISLIKILIPLILLMSILTCKGLIESPFLSRSIKSSGDVSSEILAKGIGGYEFIYFLTILTVILFCFLLLSKRFLSLKFRIFCWASFILLAITIILANYFTALNILIISFIIFLFFRRLRIRKVFFSLLVLAIIILFFSFFKLYLLNTFIDILPEGKTLDRIEMIREGVESNQSSDLFNERQSTLLISWYNFVDHPIFGVVTLPLKQGDSSDYKFGRHSQILDSFALFGIMAILQIYFILAIFVSRFGDRIGLRAFSASVLSATLILNLFDNTAPLIGVAYFFVYPSLYDWIKAKYAMYNGRLILEDETYRIRR